MHATYSLAVFVTIAASDYIVLPQFWHKKLINCKWWRVWLADKLESNAHIRVLFMASLSAQLITCSRTFWRNYRKKWHEERGFLELPIAEYTDRLTAITAMPLIIAFHRKRTIPKVKNARINGNGNEARHTQIAFLFTIRCAADARREGTESVGIRRAIKTHLYLY